MGKYRDRLEVVVDILSVISDNNGAKKTRIMYSANLSWDLLRRYLNVLLEANLVSFGSSECYTLTVKGERFLKKYNEFRRHRKKAEKRLNDVKSERMMLENMCFTMK